MSFLFLVTGGRRRRCVSIGLHRAMSIMLGVTVGIMTFTVTFVHFFMQDLGFFPAMLGAGGAEGDQGGSSKNGEGGFLHETINGGVAILGSVSWLARA